MFRNDKINEILNSRGYSTSPSSRAFSTDDSGKKDRSNREIKAIPLIELLEQGNLRGPHGEKVTASSGHCDENPFDGIEGLSLAAPLMDDEIPSWAADGEPIWLQMMHEFLFSQRPQCILLDVDMQSLPIFMHQNQMEQHAEAHDRKMGDAGTRNEKATDLTLQSAMDLHDETDREIMQPGNAFRNGLVLPRQPSFGQNAMSQQQMSRNTENMLPDDILRRDFRYLHVPRQELRTKLARFDRGEPLAIFGGSTQCSRRAEAVLREEGFTKLCNFHTYRYLRRIVKICAKRGL